MSLFGIFSFLGLIIVVGILVGAAVAFLADRRSWRIGALVGGVVPVVLMVLLWGLKALSTVHMGPGG